MVNTCKYSKHRFQVTDNIWKLVFFLIPGLIHTQKSVMYGT